MEFLDIINIFRFCQCNKVLYQVINNEIIWQNAITQLIGPGHRYYNKYLDLAKECLIGKFVNVNESFSFKIYPWETHKSLYDRLNCNSLISYSIRTESEMDDCLLGLYWEGADDLPIDNSLSDTFLIDTDDYGENLYKNVTHIDTDCDEHLFNI